MGARWPWRAGCAKGHEFSGFSGGSDGHCETGECNEPVVREVEKPFGDEPQGQPYIDPLVTRLQEQQREITALQAQLAAAEGKLSAYEAQYKTWVPVTDYQELVDDRDRLRGLVEALPKLRGGFKVHANSVFLDDLDVLHADGVAAALTTLLRARQEMT